MVASALIPAPHPQKLDFVNHPDRLIGRNTIVTRPGFASMRGARLLLAVMTALAVSACARQQPAYYVADPDPGQPVPVVAQQPYTPPQYAQPGYVQQPVAPPQYAQSQRGLY